MTREEFLKEGWGPCDGGQKGESQMIKPWIVYLSGPITGEKHAKENFEKATFTEKQKEIADTIRDASQIVTVLKDRSKEGE